MDPSGPSREIFGNIQLGWIIYIIAVIVVAIMVYAFIRRYRMWHLGKPDERLKGSLTERWKSFLQAAVIDGIIHRKFVAAFENLGHRSARLMDFKPKELLPGFAHFLIAIGCILLLIGTAMDVVSHYVYDFIKDGVYFAHSLFSDIGGLMALIGVILVFIRRYIQKPERLDNRAEDLMALLAIILIIFTGFIVEGFRIAATEMPNHPDWSRWSIGGFLVAKALINIDNNSLLVLHRVWWWLHSILTFAALLYIALNFNRLWHIIISPLNVFWRNLGPRGAMVPIDMEKCESFGVSKVEDFSWKNLLDLDACTRCGRCADSCPAKISGKPLSPKKVLQDLKGNLLEKAPALLAARAAAFKGAKTPAQAQNETPSAAPTVPVPEEAPAEPMIGGVIETEAIWNCTTCFACQEVCPVSAEPMLKIGEMRRNLVLEQACIPETAEGALRSIEDRGHPWRGTLQTRTGWFEGMGIKPMSEDRNVDVLYWVGCTEALEDRSIKVAQATAKLFKIAGVKFGVLGSQESCCGDPARRLGNEYLYQCQAQKNIETLKQYNVKKIVTGCAHCFNNLKHEYPQFGGNFEVIHHSDFILQLLNEGKLKISKGPRGLVTYHDACYLGRYNNVYEAPRKILNYVPDITLVEMERNRERSFCCGAGGGHMWLEEQKVGERINVMRTEQAMSAKAGIVATACPYCLQMFQDGIKTKAVEDTLKVMDISEILAESAVYPGQISN
jgi:Fe-S oxidoreductase/nitrate reductase gamma subunit